MPDEMDEMVEVAYGLPIDDELQPDDDDAQEGGNS